MGTDRDGAGPCHDARCVVQFPGNVVDEPGDAALWISRLDSTGAEAMLAGSTLLGIK